MEDYLVRELSVGSYVFNVNATLALVWDSSACICNASRGSWAQNDMKSYIIARERIRKSRYGISGCSMIYRIAMKYFSTFLIFDW